MSLTAEITAEKDPPRFTQGPLIVVDSGCQRVDGFHAIVRDHGNGTTTLPTAYVALYDNAVLYATAPDLLAALKRLAIQMNNLLMVADVPARFSADFNSGQRQAEAAIAKASPHPGEPRGDSAGLPETLQKDVV